MRNTYFATASNRLFRRAILATLVLLSMVVITATSHAQSFSIPESLTTMTSTPGGTSRGWVDFQNSTNHIVVIYLSLMGTDASSFDLSQRLVYLGSGGVNDSIKTRGVSVDFSPISYKVHHADLIATDSSGTTDTIHLTGNGVGAGFYMYIRGQNDSVLVGSSECNDIVIVNADSKLPLTITKLSLGTTDSSYWTTHFITIDQSNLSLPVTVNPRDSVKLRWCFAPTVNGFYFADSLIVDFTSSVGLDQSEATILSAKSTFADAPDSECILVTGTSGDTLDFGTISPGQGRGAEFTLTNPTYAECSIQSITLDGADKDHFAIYPSFALPKYIYYRDSSIQVLANFSTNPADNYTTFEATATIHTVLFDGGITTCDRTVFLRGHTAYVAPPDTLKLDLAPDSTETVDFPDSIVGCKLIEIKNNTSSNIKVDTMFLKSGEYFVLVDAYDSSYPVTVAPGNSLIADVCLIDSSMSTYDDTLVVISEGALTSTEYALHWQKAQHAAVHASEIVSELVLTANPNPSSGKMQLSFSGLHDATVQILDLLGRVVAERRGVSSNFEWDGTSMNGIPAAKGAYIARVTGRTNARTSVTLSNRVMIVR